MEKVLVKKLIAFIDNFQKNPFRYLNESDLKIGLSAFIQEIEEYKEEIKVPVTLDKYEDELKTNDADSVHYIDIPQILSEYIYFEKNNGKYVDLGQKFDLVILDKEDPKSLAQIQEKSFKKYGNEAIWLQPVKYGFELKLTAGLDNDNFNDFLYDFKDKITKYRHDNCNFIGIAMYFCHFKTRFEDIKLRIPGGEFTEIKRESLINELEDLNHKYFGIIVFRHKIYLATKNNKADK